MQWFNIGRMNSNLTAEDLKKKLHFHSRIHLIRTQRFFKREFKIEEILQTISLYGVQSYGETFRMPAVEHTQVLQCNLHKVQFY